ncbi:MAG: hypothetical protein MSA31_01710 [Bacteroidales bacterium]|nr:hypothetical protein [Bacteroidales bacterium]
MEQKELTFNNLPQLAEEAAEEAADGLQQKMQQLIEEFNAIGHVPFRDKDKMYYDYHAALDKVHKVLNADSQRRRMEKLKADIELFKQQLKELNESK